MLKKILIVLAIFLPFNTYGLTISSDKVLLNQDVLATLEELEAKFSLEYGEEQLVGGTGNEPPIYSMFEELSITNWNEARGLGIYTIKSYDSEDNLLDSENFEVVEKLYSIINIGKDFSSSTLSYSKQLFLDLFNVLAMILGLTFAFWVIVEVIDTFNYQKERKRGGI